MIVVTARPSRFLREIDGLDLHGIAVCANGAMVVDLDTLKPVTASILPKDAALDIVQVLRRMIPGITFAVETLEWFGHEPAYRPEWPAPEGSPKAAVETLVTDGVIKLLGRHPEIHVSRLDEISDAVGRLASVTCSTHSGLLEIGPAGVTKASALADVVQSLGQSADQVIAIGDMPNDLPMLRWARISAAVANAHPDLLAFADHVVPSNDDDGVAHLLERLFAAHTPSG